MEIVYILLIYILTSYGSFILRKNYCVKNDFPSVFCFIPIVNIIAFIYTSIVFFIEYNRIPFHLKLLINDLLKDKQFKDLDYKLTNDKFNITITERDVSINGEIFYTTYYKRFFKKNDVNKYKQLRLLYKKSKEVKNV